MADLTASAGLVRGLLDFAVSKGADRCALAVRAGVDLAALEDPDGRAPFGWYASLMKRRGAYCADNRRLSAQL